jgi:hypothetical protein
MVLAINAGPNEEKRQAMNRAKRNIPANFLRLLAVTPHILIQQPHQFLNLPNVIGQPGLHGGRDAKRLVDPAVVIVHEVKGNDVGVIQCEGTAVFVGKVPHSGQRSGVARRS